MLFSFTVLFYGKCCYYFPISSNHCSNNRFTLCSYYCSDIGFYNVCPWHFWICKKLGWSRRESNSIFKPPSNIPQFTPFSIPVNSLFPVFLKANLRCNEGSALSGTVGACKSNVRKNACFGPVFSENGKSPGFFKPVVCIGLASKILFHSCPLFATLSG